MTPMTERVTGLLRSPLMVANFLLTGVRVYQTMDRETIAPSVNIHP
jgi:hypothetical protein